MRVKQTARQPVKVNWSGGQSVETEQPRIKQTARRPDTDTLYEVTITVKKKSDGTLTIEDEKVLEGLSQTIKERVSQTNTTRQVQCNGFTTKGERCKKRCSSTVGYCMYHDREDTHGEQLFLRKCCAITSKGNRCRNVMKTPDPNRKYCYAHIPVPT